MPDIRTDSGTLRTEDIPQQYEPHFCGQCGGRLGWNDTAISDSPTSYCDGCMVEIINKEEEGR